MSAAAADFHSQIASIMEVLANAAVAEICKVVDDGYTVVQLEVSRSQKENENLRKKIQLLELQVSRYRAERLKGADGSAGYGRFPGVRLNRRYRGSSGPSVQVRTKFLNQSIIMDQDPDQEVVTATKSEPVELLVDKVEGATEAEVPKSEVPSVAIISPEGQGSTNTSAFTTSLSATSKDNSAERTLSFSAVSAKSDSHNSDTSNILGVSSTSRTMSSTIASQPSSSSVLSGIEATVAAQQRAHFQVQKSQEASIMHSEGRRRSFICRICGKAFTGQSNLEAHERVHTGEKPYRCDTCGKHFSEAGNLKKHQRIHRGEKPFRCSTCGKMFSEAGNLKKHHHVHTGEQPYSCGLCYKRFTWIRNLKTHQQKNHPEFQGIDVTEELKQTVNFYD